MGNNISPEWSTLYDEFHIMLEGYIEENRGRIKRFFDKGQIKQETHNAIRSHFIKNEVGMIKTKTGRLNPDREGMVVNSSKFESEALKYFKETQTRPIHTRNDRIFIYEPGARYMTHNFSMKQFKVSEFASFPLIPSSARGK